MANIPLHAGYSKATVSKNIALLEKNSTPRILAVRLSFDHARMSYFKKHPDGALPQWLAYPRNNRLVTHYTDSGAPLRDGGKNPVRELDIPAPELEEIKNAVQKQMRGKGADVRKAAELFTDFTGHDDPRLSKIRIPQMPKAVLAIGQVDGIMYSTVRDNVAEKYIHEFRKSSRPLLAASPDGKQLYLIGGSYDFTERGIVDS